MLLFASLYKPYVEKYSTIYESQRYMLSTVLSQMAEIEDAKSNLLSNFKVLLFYHCLTHNSIFCSNYSILLFLQHITSEKTLKTILIFENDLVLFQQNIFCYVLHLFVPSMKQLSFVCYSVCQDGLTFKKRQIVRVQLKDSGFEFHNSS